MSIELNYINRYHELNSEKLREEVEQSRILEGMIIAFITGITPTLEQLKSLRMKEVRNHILANDDEERVCIL